MTNKRKEVCGNCTMWETEGMTDGEGFCYMADLYTFSKADSKCYTGDFNEKKK